MTKKNEFAEGVRVPIGFEAVAKTLRSDLKTWEESWKANRTKSETEQKNHFALKRQLYIKAWETTFTELRRLQNLYVTNHAFSKV